jgi:hypothetical protein
VKWGLEAPGLRSVPPVPEIEGLNSLNHQETIRDVLININFYLQDVRIEKGEGGYVLSEMLLVYSDAPSKKYRIPDLTVYDDEDNPYTVIEIYDKGKRDQAENVYNDIAGSIKWFYYFEIKTNTLMEAKKNRRNGCF